MKDDGTSSMLGDSTSVQQQLTTIIGLLTKKGATEEAMKPGLLKSLQDNLFPEQKSERSSFRRLKQKQKTYQGVPIAIDSITPDGRRDIRKAFSNVISFDIDYDKPEKKSGPWSKFFFFLALLFGVLTGFVMQVIKDVKNIFKFLKTKFLNLFSYLSKTKIGQVVTRLFRSIKLKFLNALRALKNLSIVKSIRSFFSSFKASIASKFKSLLSIGKGIFDSVSKRVMSIFNSVKAFITKIRNFFKPITSFLSKFKAGKILSLPMKLFKSFMGFFSKLSGFFKIGLKLGRLVGKLLWPIFAIIETVTGLFKAFSDPKLKDKSFLQKLVTGLVAGIAGFFDIFSIFGLELFGFDEIRDRFDKIFSAFKEGFFKGIFEWVNQIFSYIVSFFGKIVGWVVGWFNKDAGKAITEWSKNFDLFEGIKKVIGSIVGFFKKIFSFVDSVKESISKAYDKIKEFATGLYDKIVNFVKGITDFISNLFNFSKIKDWVKDKLGLGDKTKEVTINRTTPVGDLMDTEERTLYSGRGAYRFDRQDELLAVKKDGPIAEILANSNRESVTALKALTNTTKKIGDVFEKFSKTAVIMQEKELRILTENLTLLKELKDKNVASNVVVQNNSNSNIFSEKTSSNIDLRRDLALRGNFPF